jgi:chorismate dehydratase
LAPNPSKRLRVAAIHFLNPAPLMWDFEHQPAKDALAERYEIHYTHPAQCADEIIAGRADLGLIPIASLTEELAIVPGCAIASLDRVRSIQLIVKLSGGSGEDVDRVLASVRTIAADTASRSSLAYAQIVFRRFIGTDPEFLPAPADPVAMLAHADAALLIGDPALLALEARDAIEHAAGPCLWLDLAHEWSSRAGVPWVAAVWAVRPAAVWAVRPEALRAGALTSAQLIDNLHLSRDQGLAHIDALVAEWTPRIALPPETIRDYLTRNIHYTLDDGCIAAIGLFRKLAAEADILPPLNTLRFL